MVDDSEEEKEVKDFLKRLGNNIEEDEEEHWQRPTRHTFVRMMMMVHWSPTLPPLFGTLAHVRNPIP